MDGVIPTYQRLGKCPLSASRGTPTCQPSENEVKTELLTQSSDKCHPDGPDGHVCRTQSLQPSTAARKLLHRDPNFLVLDSCSANLPGLSRAPALGWDCKPLSATEGQLMPKKN